MAPPSNSDDRVEPEALSRTVLWEARTARLDLLCACGRRPVESKVLGCCRLCYQRRYQSVRWFGGLRDLILKRDRFKCRVFRRNAFGIRGQKHFLRNLLVS